jgi:hypothetical protein
MNIHVIGGFQTHNPSNLGAADLCLRPQGHRNRRHQYIFYPKDERTLLTAIKTTGKMKMSYIINLRCYIVNGSKKDFEMNGGKYIYNFKTGRSIMCHMKHIKVEKEICIIFLMKNISYFLGKTLY